MAVTKFTKRRLLMLLPLAVVAGFILTLLFTGQENFKNSRSCASPYFAAPQVKSVDCSTLEQGYPFRILKTTQDISTDNTGETLQVFSAPKILTYRLIADVAIWSVVSLVLLQVLVPAGKKSKK